MPQLTITFGLHLDGQRATTPANTLGEITAGPLGLLTLIETQLGLLVEHPSQAERIVQYRDCLSQADAPSRFYHQTFAIDPLGTAATLLNWRDTWYLHGWDGLSPPSGSRIADLATVDGYARNTVAPSLGERLAKIARAIAQRKPTIHEIRLVDPLAAFPKRWQDVLTLLPVVDVPTVAAHGAGFLSQLQKSLVDAASSQPLTELTWQDDGTVEVVRAETRYLASAWLATQIDGSCSFLLVATSDAARLDATLTSANRPRQGLSESSAFRPTLQVLPLALEILWEPLNFFGFVQFLTHPVCPVPGYARRKLAEVVADAPGIGGKGWRQVLAEIDAHYGEKIAPSVRTKINLWLEHPRYSLDSGVPINVVLTRVDCLADFFRARLGDSDTASRMAFQAGFSQCRACAEALRFLEAQGVANIRPRQLQKLVAQATAHGTDNPLLFAEVGAQRAIKHPGAAVEAADRVVWWQLSMPVLPSAYPWSALEVETLSKVGVQLPAMEDRLVQAAQEWLRPILSARKKLILVLPPMGEEVHPLWQMIEAVVKHPRVKLLEQFLTKLSTVTHPAQHQPLPAPKRWWRLPDDVSVLLRNKESFSSLELMLFNPYHWLLKYPAKLRPSRVVSMGGDFRMLGNLAHGLVDIYYQRTDALQMSDIEFDAWFAGAFDQLVAEEGALLLMAGHGSEIEAFRYRLHHSMHTLRQQIAAAGITGVTSEMELVGRFAGGELSGYADLVMHNAHGEHAIVDMKWSGARKYPEKLKQNRHLQLAIYAELLRQKTLAWPSVAYYILDRARFFAPDQRLFLDAEAVSSKSGENTAQLWQRFIETWKWRKAQLDSGSVEVMLEGLAPTVDSAPPDSAMSMEYLSEAYNDYRGLAGWDR